MNSSAAVLNCQPPVSHHHGRRSLSRGLVEFSYMDRKRLNPRTFTSLCLRNDGGDGNRSSVSSEGFCENETDIPDISEPQVVLVRRCCAHLNNCGDTDSQVLPSRRIRIVRRLCCLLGRALHFLISITLSIYFLCFPFH